MNLSGLGNQIINGASKSVDPGAFIKQEIEEGLSPVTERIDRLEKKLDKLIALMQTIDVTLKKIQPAIDLMLKLPFFKK